MKKFPNLDNPKTFNEKLQWMKLHDRKPEYTMMVDKVKVKDYVAGLIGEEHIIPTLGVWERPEDINFDALPNQFVLKCNHNSGGLFICKDKSKLTPKEWKKALRRLRKALKHNFYYFGREWPYKDVPRRILAEQFMVDESGTELKDYKIFCFNGKPEFIEVDFDRFVNHKRNLYTTDWEFLNKEIQFKCDPNHQIARPEHLDEMLKFASILSKGHPHLRTDFYVINNKIYFGELTFYHGTGMEEFRPKEWNEELGGLILLPC